MMTSWTVIISGIVLAFAMTLVTMRRGADSSVSKRIFLVVTTVMLDCVAILLCINRLTGTVGNIDDFGAFFALFGWNM